MLTPFDKTPLRRARWLFCFAVLLTLGAPARAADAAPPVPFQGDEGTWGYLDAQTLKVVIAPRFADAAPFHDGASRVTLVADDAGAQTVRCVTRSGRPVPCPVQGGLGNWIDTRGQLLFDESFASASALELDDAERTRLSDLFRVTLADGRSGVISVPERRWVVAPQAEGEITALTRERFLIGRTILQDGQARYHAPKGMVITSVDARHRLFYIEAMDAQDEYSTRGLVTWEGEVRVPPRYGDVEHDAAAQRSLAMRLAGLTQLLARTWLKAPGAGAGPVTDLLDEHGKVLRTFGAKYSVAFTKDPAVGSYLPRESDALQELRYFSTKTGQDLSASQAGIERGPQIFKSGERMGVKAANGAVLIPATWHTLTFFNDTLLIATREPFAPRGAIDLQGRVVVPFEYSDLRGDGMGRLQAVRAADEKIGVFDVQGRVAVPFNFSHDFLYEGGLAIVRENGQQGVIDARGASVIAAQYDELMSTPSPDKTGTTSFVAKKGKRWGLLSATGAVLVPFEYGYVSIDQARFAQGWVNVESPDRQAYGLVNIRTGTVIAPQWQNGVQIRARYLIASRYVGNNNYRYQMLKQDGTPLTDDGWEKMEPIQGEHVLVRKDRLMGVLDASGQVRIPIKYRYIWDEGNGLVRAETTPDHYVYVDLNGKEYRPQP